MSEFRAHIVADLDTSGVESKINALNGKKIKLEVDSNNFNKGLNTLNTGLTNTTKRTATFGTTIRNALNIGSTAAIVAKGFQLINTAAKNAKEAVKDFDNAVRDVRIVTNASYADAAKLVRQYNEVGKAMGATTKEVADQGVVWLRQGKTTEETNQLLHNSMVFAKTAMLDEADAATYLTSALNGYKVSVSDSMSVVDKLTKLDSSAAITAGGLAEGMSRTASQADLAGVSMDKLLGYLAVMGEVTQQNMSSVGNAFKTVLARFTNIKTGKFEFIDEDGTTEILSDVEQVLDGVGIKLRDGQNEFRNLGDVLDEVGAKWNTYTSLQKTAIATAAAGTRQRNLFITLMENYDKATEYMNISANSAGTAEKKFAAYLDSIEAKTKTLQASFESLATNTFTPEMFGGIIDATTDLVEFIDKTNLLQGTLKGLAAAGAIKAFTTIATGIQRAAIELNGFNTALNVVKAGNLGTAEIEQLAALTMNLSNSQLRAVLASQMLTAEQRVAILTAQGLSATEAQATITAMGLATAQGTAAGATATLSGAFKGLWATLTANPLVMVAAGIAAVVTAYSTIQRKQEEARKETLERGKAAAEEAQNIRELYAEYQKVSDAYKNNAATKEELSTATDSLLEALGTERWQIQNLADDYSNLDEKVKSLVENALALKRMDMAEALSVAGSSFRKATKKPEFTLTGNYGANGYLVDALLADGYLSSDEVSKGEVNMSITLDVDVSTTKGAKEAYERVVNIRNQLLDIAQENGINDATLRNTFLWHEIDNYITNLEEKYTEYYDTLQSYGKELARSKYSDLGKPVPQTVKEYEDLQSSLVNAITSQDDFTGSQEDAKQIADGFIKSLDLTISDFDVFKSKANKLSKKTLNDFVDGTQLSTEQTKELAKWLEDSGYSAEQAAPYFARLAEEMRSASGEGISTDSSIASLTSLQEELKQTTADLEAYKQALEGGEKGDAAKEYKDAWNKAIADVEAGMYDTQAVHAAAKLFFSDSQLQEMGYDLQRVGKELQSPFFEAIFGGDDDSNIGLAWLNYIKENQEQFKNSAKIDEHEDGTVDYSFTSAEDLSEDAGIAVGAISALNDALDVFGAESMISGAKFEELSTRFHEGGNDVKAFIDSLAAAGRDEFEITSILDSLTKAGEIKESDYAGIDLVKTISEAVSKAKEDLATTETPTLDVDTSAGLATAEAFEQRLNEIANGTYVAKLTVETDDTSEETASREVGSILDDLMAGRGNRLPSVGLDNSGLIAGVAESESALDGLDGEDVSASANLEDNVTGPLNAAMSNFLAQDGKSISLRANVSTGSISSMLMPHFAGGTKDAPGGPALVNELGPELISDNGKAYIAGGGKPTITNLSPGAIVLDAQQTKQAFSKTYRNIPINAFASGTRNSLLHGGSIPAHAMVNAPIDGGGGRRTTIIDRIKNIAAKVVDLNGKVNGNKKSGGGGGGGGGNSSSSKTEEVKKEKVDWIEIAIDRIERAVEKLNNVFESGYKKLSTRIDASAKEIAKINEEISMQQKAAERYMREADSVGLSSELAAKVRDGTIQIEEYDENTRNLITDYKKFYEQSLACSEAVDTLHNSLAELYEARFEAKTQEFENRINSITHSATMLQSQLDLLTAQGLKESADYYVAMSNLTQNKVEMLRKEYKELSAEMQTAMDSGEIEEYSEAWYSFNDTLQSINEEIASSNVEIQKFSNQIRQLRWDNFDYLQDKISQIKQEADFMIGLLESSDLFDDAGQITANGRSVMGLHGQNYDVLIEKADKYAEEVKNINKELAKDPYNQDLIKRREQLLKLQQESISAAQAEKQAIIDLVKDGINAQLAAMKETIESYKDSLDNAKSLFDYQQKLADKTSDIAKLQKQLAAYSGDQSEETRATVQKLQTQLANAQKDLQQTEYERNISEQKKLLDNLYTEYEETLNSRLDDTDALIAEVNGAINNSAEDIITALEESASKYGYEISDSMRTIWTDGWAVYDAQLNSIGKEFTGVHAAVNDIASYVAAIANAGGLNVSTQDSVSLRDALRDLPVYTNAENVRYNVPEPTIKGIEDYAKISGNLGTEIRYGDINNNVTLNIPIDHVLDYNDFVSKLQRDNQFEDMILSMTIDRLTDRNRSGQAKYKYKW